MNKHGIQKFIVSLLFCGILAILTGTAWAENQRYDLDLPAGALAAGLKSLSRQADLKLDFDRQRMEGKVINRLRGRFTVRQALERLLAGSGIDYRFATENNVVLYAEQSETALTLDAITVEARRRESYAVQRAPTATKTDVPVFDTPVSIQAISKDVIQDQQAISTGDALKNVSGLFDLKGPDGFWDQFFLRGFKTDSRHYVDGLRVPSDCHSLANIERIEVLKGPAAMLYGRLGEPGGLVNFVTKRPQETPYYSIQQQFGSYSHYRTLVDLTGPLTKDGTLLYRLNAEYRDSESFLDYVTVNRKLFAPSLTWKIGTDTQIDFDFSYHELQGALPGGIPAVGTEPADIHISTFLGEPTDENHFRVYNGGITFAHRFNKQLKMLAKIAAHEHMQDFACTCLTGLNENTGMASRMLYYVDSYDDRSYVGDANLTGKFEAFGAEHTLLTGLDYHYSEDGSIDWYYTLNDINIYQPNYDTTIVGEASGPWYREVEWYGLYLQDQVKLVDQWHLLLGGRYDFARETRGNFEDDTTDYKDEEFSPRIGLMYHPVSWLGIFGDYVHGFNKCNRSRLTPGTDSEPERSNQYELGFKGQWLEERLNASLVFYHLTKENISQPASDAALAALGYNELAGEARSQGIEFDISGLLTEWLKIIGTYSYTDAEITKNNTGNEGNRLMCVPRHAGSLWAKMDFREFGYSGLTAGGGVFYQGEREGDNANSFQLPDFVRFDASLGYKWDIRDKAVSLQFNIENIFDEEYYAGTTGRLEITRGQPRTLLGSIRLEF